MIRGRRSPRNRFQSAAENVDVDDLVADSLPGIPPPWLSLDRRHRHSRSSRRSLLSAMSSNTLKSLDIGNLRLLYRTLPSA
jgi:hypothetical protein